MSFPGCPLLSPSVGTLCQTILPLVLTPRIELGQPEVPLGLGLSLGTTYGAEVW